jgi:hypothetical protein
MACRLRHQRRSIDRVRSGCPGDSWGFLAVPGDSWGLPNAFVFEVFHLPRAASREVAPRALTRQHSAPRNPVFRSSKDTLSTSTNEDQQIIPNHTI